jgi:hypothetical protein
MRLVLLATLVLAAGCEVSNIKVNPVEPTLPADHGAWCKAMCEPTSVYRLDQAACICRSVEEGTKSSFVWPSEAQLKQAGNVVLRMEPK